jgi:hypothetical protein
MLADKRYCYPLTSTDFASRYLICCDALATTREVYAFTVFERAFRDFGLPLAICTDNEVPFASASAFFGLSKLSVWWLRLGIGIERIKPGNPQQNGRHERMHLTLKKDPACGQELPAAGQVRPLHPVLQPRAATSGGIKEGSEKIWVVSFMQYDLGFFDDEPCRIESAENPFVARVSHALSLPIVPASLSRITQPLPAAPARRYMQGIC